MSGQLARARFPELRLERELSLHDSQHRNADEAVARDLEREIPIFEALIDLDRVGIGPLAGFVQMRADYQRRQRGTREPDLAHEENRTEHRITVLKLAHAERNEGQRAAVLDDHRLLSGERFQLLKVDSLCGVLLGARLRLVLELLPASRLGVAYLFAHRFLSTEELVDDRLREDQAVGRLHQRIGAQRGPQGLACALALAAADETGGLIDASPLRH